MTTVTITLRDDRGNLIEALRYETDAIGPTERKTPGDVLRTLLRFSA